MYSPQKLHPIAYLGSVVNAFRNLWIPLVIVFFNQRETIMSGNISLTWIFGVVGIFLFLVILFGGLDFINKYRTRFWIEDGKFIYKDGILTRREKEFDIERIQSIDFSEPIFHRLFKAVKLQVFTPGEGIVIDTMKKTQAEALQSIIYDEQEKIAQDKKDVENVQIGDASPWPRQDGDAALAEAQPKRTFEVLHRLSRAELLLMSMTSGALGAFLAIVFAILNIIGTQFIVERYIDYFGTLFQNSMIALSVAVIFFVAVGYAIGVIILYIKYHDYALYKKGDDLAVEYGLLEKKHKSVNVNRVQNIIIRDSLIRRMIGYYSLSVTITSDTFEGEDATSTVELMPFIKRNTLYEVIEEILPNYDVIKPEGCVPLRGYRRYFQVSTVILILATAAVQYYLLSWAWILGLGVMAVTIAAGVYAARNNGYVIRDDEINLLTTGFFTRSHFVIKHDKVIEGQITENPFLIRSKLANISVTTAAGIVGSTATVRFIDRQDIGIIWDWIKEGGRTDEENISESDQIMED
ncbi:PH domain-containing protein [Salinicoccus halitifaciens]|uniref:Membrane protein n=1 Tax=Salinicoccus halitifaciens TaxID=1073415 RepID=A0ABV2E996_9STAP|nr:PH domain-containing protein [Salinicoccus halitifaciens]MCD2138099.1 PH domain-containing protein [Salinicoccus halitifaciens]